MVKDVFLAYYYYFLSAFLPFPFELQIKFLFFFQQPETDEMCAPDLDFPLGFSCQGEKTEEKRKYESDLIERLFICSLLLAADVLQFFTLISSHSSSSSSNPIEPT